MSHRSRLAGQLAMLTLVGLLVVAFPAGFALAQDLADPGATTQSNHTLVPIINLTSTPTETPTATRTATPTPTPKVTATPTSGGGGDGSGGDTGAEGQRLVVDDGSGATGGVTSEEDCSNANYTKIQPAVDDAAQGDIVVVCAGTYESVTVETRNLTLRAHGAAVIESSGQPAVRTIPPRVTVRGFTIRTTGAEYSLAVGGRDSLVRDNTVEPNGANSTGIFLSDGLTAEGAPDPMLGAAIGSHVVNNTVNRSEQTRSVGVFTDADQTVIRGNTFFATNNMNSIRSAGNQTVIRENMIRNLNPCRQAAFDRNECTAEHNPPAILIGKYNPDVYYRAGGSLCGGPGDNSTHAHHNWARNNRIVNNFVSQTPGEGLHVMGTGAHADIIAAITGTAVMNNTLLNTGGVTGWSNRAIYRNNTVDADNVQNQESTTYGGDNENGLCLHAHNTRIIANELDGYTGPNMMIAGARNITIRRNSIKFGNPALRVSMRRGHWRGKVEVVESISITNNTIRNGSSVFGNVVIRENVSKFTDNTITGSLSDGVQFSGGGDAHGSGSTARNPEISEFHHNRITGNSQTGIVLSPNTTVTDFHHNIIDNNGYLGINKENQDKTDGRWPIVNATRNIWGCGGPSGGLEDPYTNRTANGSGDPISAGDDAGKSNIHFDPFFVQADLDCQSSGSTPTPSPTPTPTPNPTPTSAGPGGDGEGTGGGGGDGGNDGPGSGGDGTGGAGSGDGGGANSDGPSGSSDGGGESDDTATPPPTSSATPSGTPTATPPPTPTPTVTLSPTPAVEPGFGVLTWLIGVTLLGGLLAVRRRFDPDEAESHD